MKHCTFLQKNSRSVFLKNIAYTSTACLVFPDYKLSWEHPIQTDCLLILDATVNPGFNYKHFPEYKWVLDIPILECMPRTAACWEKVLGRKPLEIVL